MEPKDVCFMKKSFVFLLLVLSFSIFAQVSSDINDYFYKDLTRWETLDLVKNLPHARPYPLQLVKTILNTVIENGDFVQKEIAQAHYDRFFTKKIFLGGKSEAALDVNSESKQLALALSFDLNYEVNPLVSASMAVNAHATTKLPKDESLPYTVRSNKDLVNDDADVGPFKLLPYINSSFAVGTDSIYINAGLMRSSYGPIHEDGVVFDPKVMHSAHIDFTYNHDFWMLNSSFYALSATKAGSPNSFYPNKYLAIHSLELRPFHNLSLSLLESMVYGERFDISYLLPLTPYMVNSSIYGFDDNSLIGFMGSYCPIDSIKIDGIFYMDDMSFNDLVRLKIDTKWRSAQQIRLSWAPQKSGILNLISFDYTQVFPFMYTHRIDRSGIPEHKDQVNYLNYTHAGQGIGSSLEPNSDKILLKIGLTPLEKFDVDIFASYIRHGNINENLVEEEKRKYIELTEDYEKDWLYTDGSIYNHSYQKYSDHVFQHKNPFLIQEHLRQNIQTGFDINCRLPVLKTGGYMVFKLGYTLELDCNSGVSNQMYYSDATATEDNWKTIADTQYNAWLDGLGGKDVHNYIRLGFEYFF